jgi:hypothetical protein
MTRSARSDLALGASVVVLGFDVFDLLGALWTAIELRAPGPEVEGLIEEGEAFRRLSEVRK